MGLLSKLKLPEPPGAAKPDAAPTSPTRTPAAKTTGKVSDAVRKAAKAVLDVGNGVPEPVPKPPAQTPAAKTTGKVSDAVRKAAKAVLGVGDGVPEPPPKKGGIGDVADAVKLAVRVQAADQQMNAALAAANSVGNPLDSRTSATPEAPARKVWQAAMVKYWQPGSAARDQALTLKGEARIAKAQEAADLLAQARAVFQQALQSLG